MTPSDWWSVLSMVLSSAQYTVWASEYKEHVIVQVTENISAGLGTGENELLGRDNDATEEVQVALPRAVFTQAADWTLKALRKAPDLGRRQASFLSIRQRSQEPYVQFLDRLQTAVMRQIEQEEVAEILLFQLATGKRQQGPSTTVGVPDLRSKQGELQPKTVQPLQRSTARSTSSHHTGWVSKPGTAGTCGPAPGRVCRAPPLSTDGLPSLGNQQPGPAPARLPGPTQKWRDDNHLPYIQALGWKKFIQFSYCGRTP